MKYLISLTFLLCSLVVYAQDTDLIVTTGGDSLKCKIVEINANEIQFRFGTGGIISIPRNEVASYQYNFTSAPSTTTLPATNRDTRTNYVDPPANTVPAERKKREKSVAEHQPFYVAITGGASTFGTVSFGKITKGGPLVVGANIAYFFHPNIGAGLKVNMGFCEVDFGESSSFTYKEKIWFFGPSLYGRWGKDKFTFTTSAGVGALTWVWLLSPKEYGLIMVNSTPLSVGGFLSAGVNYMLTQHLGIGLNLQSVIGTGERDGNIRNPTGLGATLGINFRF